MDEFLHLIDHSDVCSLTGLAIGLVYVGLFFSSRYPDIRSRSLQVAGIAFVFYAAYGLLEHGTPDASTVTVVLIRGVLLLGIVHGSLSIVLSVFRPLTENWRKSAVQRQSALEQRQRERQEEQRRREERLVWERQAPERERREREAETERLRQEGESQRQAELVLDEHRRRDEARLQCRLYYDRNVDQLQKHFNREMLQEYFDSYMNDSQSANDVEHRAGLLIGMLKEQLEERSERTMTYNSISEIADYFNQKRAELESGPFDDETLESLRVEISQNETAAISALLKRSR